MNWIKCCKEYLPQENRITFQVQSITITENHKIEVSRRIKEEFENGREYYHNHGKELSVLPMRNKDKPLGIMWSGII